MKAIFDDRQWKHQPRHFMTNGAILPNPEQAERIVAGGQADLVALARGMLYDPRWAWHAADALGASDRARYPDQYARCRPSVR